MRINMSNVIDRSEFLTSFSITLQYSLNLVGGRYTNHKETKTARGVVTQASGVNVSVADNGKIISGAIRIHTSERLTVGFGIKDNDIVEYNNRQYLVKSLGDYSSYGQGFFDAYCELINNEGCNDE